MKKRYYLTLIRGKLDAYKLADLENLELLLKDVAKILQIRGKIELFPVHGAPMKHGGLSFLVGQFHSATSSLEIETVQALGEMHLSGYIGRQFRIEDTESILEAINKHFAFDEPESAGSHHPLSCAARKRFGV